MIPESWINGHETRNVAVILAGGFGALGLIRELGRQSIPVVVLSATEFLTKSRHCVGFVVQNEPETLQSLLQIPALLAKKPLLFTDNDTDLDLIYAHWDVLSDLYILSTHLNNRRLTDKSLLHQAALAAAIPVPKTYTNESQWNANKFPLIIKPLEKENLWQRSGMRGQKGYVCKNKDELIQTLRMFQQYNVACVTQELILGDVQTLYGITLYRNHHGQTHTAFIVQKLRQFPVDNGTGSTHVTCNIPVIIEHSKKLLDSVDYCGVADIEYKFDTATQQYFLIEVNGRFPEQYGIIEKLRGSFGTVGSEKSFGPFIYENLLHPSHTPTSDYRAPETSIAWVLFVNDLRSMLQEREIRKWFLYFTGIFRYRIQGAVFRWSDLRPTLYYWKYLTKTLCTKILQSVFPQNSLTRPWKSPSND